MKTTKFGVVIYNGEVCQESVFETLQDAIVELACAIENNEAGDAQRLDMDYCILWDSKDGIALDLADDPCYLQSLAGSYAGVPLKEDEHISFEIGGPLIPFAMCGLPMKSDLDAYSISKTV